MSKLIFSIIINAPREKVWDAMLSDATYREWTAPFNPGSRYDGNWEKGSKIKFIGADPETGKEFGGMYAEIAENRLHEFVSIKHLGEIGADGTEIPWPGPEEAGFENYTFTDKNGSTEVLVELSGIPDQWKQMMNDTWPKALEKLKEIAERQ